MDGARGENGGSDVDNEVNEHNGANGANVDNGANGANEANGANNWGLGADFRASRYGATPPPEALEPAGDPPPAPPKPRTKGRMVLLVVLTVVGVVIALDWWNFLHFAFEATEGRNTGDTLPFIFRVVVTGAYVAVVWRVL